MITIFAAFIRGICRMAIWVASGRKPQWTQQNYNSRNGDTMPATGQIQDGCLAEEFSGPKFVLVGRVRRWFLTLLLSGALQLWNVRAAVAGRDRAGRRRPGQADRRNMSMLTSNCHRGCVAELVIDRVHSDVNGEHWQTLFNR